MTEMLGMIDENLLEWKESIAQKKEFAGTIKQPITFSWYNISAYSIHEENEHKYACFYWWAERDRSQKKLILDNVSGTAYPGELFVMMGSSGAGKTTLLNCITFRNVKNLKVSGMVHINDVPTTQKKLAFKSAYVQQDDLFVPCLTVREHLIFQARLRMGPNYTYDEKIKRLEEVMLELSLSGCQDVLIGIPGVLKGISGGERKRLALASELLTNPSLLFCDEPTTGLDSFMALNVVQTLKSLAMSGRTVICTLHQPSSELFELFDKICLISEGRSAFLGTRKEAEEFFIKLRIPCPVNFNPGDHYVQMLSVIPGREQASRRNIKCISEAFYQSSMGKRILKKSANLKTKPSEDQWKAQSSTNIPYKVGWCEQFRVLLWRSSLAIKKNPKIVKMKFLSYLNITILMSLLYAGQTLNSQGVQNITGALFLFLTNATFKNISGVMVTFCSELPLFLREHKNAMYRTDVYFLAKSLADLPLFSIFNLMFTGFSYIIIGLNPGIMHFIITLFITLLVTYTVLGIGYVISVSSPNLVIAQQLTAGVITPFYILGGFFIEIKSVPAYLHWLGDLSWFKWGNLALLINQWSDIGNITCTEPMSQCKRSGYEVLESYGIAGPDSNLTTEFYRAVFALTVLCIAARLIAFLILQYKARNYDG